MYQHLEAGTGTMICLSLSALNQPGKQVCFVTVTQKIVISMLLVISMRMMLSLLPWSSFLAEGYVYIWSISLYFFHLLALDNFSSLVSETIILKILLSDDYLTSSNNRKKGAYNFSMPSFRVFFFSCFLHDLSSCSWMKGSWKVVVGLEWQVKVQRRTGKKRKIH